VRSQLNARIVSLHEDNEVWPDGFAELVERARLATNEVCDKAKLVLRLLLPGVEALQRGNARFSPRLMLVMLSRTDKQLTTEERERLQDILEHAEAFQPHLTGWIMAMKGTPVDVVGLADADECARFLDRMTRALSDLDMLLAKVGRNWRAG
jgi:hypothetical protein